MYDISCDSSDSELNPDSSDSENKSVEDGEQEGEVLDVEGDRFIDVEILNRNIELCCNYCHQPVLHLIEASRKGLASEFVCFVFFSPCSNKRCDNQTSFPSCPVIQVGNLCGCPLVNRRANFVPCVVHGAPHILRHHESTTSCAQVLQQ